MKSKIKCTIYIISNIMIFIIIFHFLTILFVRKANGYGTDIFNFYKLEKNSIDILFLGSSHTYTAFNPYLIEEKTGLNGYILATQQQPIWITYYYYKEALKYQKPKYVVIDVHMLISSDSEYAQEQVNRDAIDKMKWSRNKFDVINLSVKKEDRNSYYFNIIKYHSRYKELNPIDWKTVFNGYTIDNKGYKRLNFQGNQYDKNSIGINSEVSSIFYKNTEYMEKIIKLSNENNINLLLVKTPAIYSKEDYSKLNFVKIYAEENKIKLIDFIGENMISELDYKTDFYDKGHLDGEGSDKFSNEFIKYLDVLNE